MCAPVGNSSTTSLNNGGNDRRSVRAVPSALPNGDPSILTDRRNTRPLARGDSRVKSLIGELFPGLGSLSPSSRPGNSVSPPCVECFSSLDLATNYLHLSKITEANKKELDFRG